MAFGPANPNFDYKEGNNTSYQARIYQQQQSKISYQAKNLSAATKVKLTKGVFFF